MELDLRPCDQIKTKFLLDFLRWIILSFKTFVLLNLGHKVLNKVLNNKDVTFEVDRSISPLGA